MDKMRGSSVFKMKISLNNISDIKRWILNGERVEPPVQGCSE